MSGQDKKRFDEWRESGFSMDSVPNLEELTKDEWALVESEMKKRRLELENALDSTRAAA